MDLEEGFPEAIKLSVAGWSHIQELDYEQLPFKCKHCHGYGHFAKHCKKKAEEQIEKRNGDQWTLVQRTAQAKKDVVKRAATGNRNTNTPIQEKGGLHKKSVKTGSDMF